MPESNRKVKGTIHWVSVAHALPVEVRLYDRLFTIEDPAGADVQDIAELLNPESETIIPTAYAEEWLAKAKPGEHYQFQRVGYFTVDKDSTPEHIVFNRTVSLKDTWSKMKDK